MAKEWFWYEDEVLKGPAEIDDLAELCHREELSSSTLVWRDGDERRPLREALIQFGKLPPEFPGVPPALPEPYISIASPRSTFLSLLDPPDPGKPPLPPHLVEQGWTDAETHPWRRYFARLMDATIHGSLMFFILGVVLAYSPVDYETFFSGIASNRILDTVLTLAVAIPVNALVLGLTGSSLGKIAFGIKVLGQDYRPIGFLPALSREVDVWFRGFGLGVPFVSLFTLITAYKTLNNTGATTWDRSRQLLVLSRIGGAKTVIFIIAGVLVWISLVVLLQSLR